MTEFIELYNGVADPLTGEIINIFDPTLPLIEKVDAACWLLKQIEAEQALCDERKKLWDEKKKRLAGFKDKVREMMKDSLIGEGRDTKIKTMENTIYLTKKTDYGYDLNEIPISNQVATATLEMPLNAFLDMEKDFAIIGSIKKVDVDINKKHLPTLVQSGLVEEINKQTLTIRSATHTKE